MSLLKSFLMEKINYMYATIKGSPTENDGVFSEFSSSNYLELQEPFKLNADTFAEINIKVNISNLVSWESLFGTIGSYGLTLSINGANHIYLNVGNGESWILERGGTTTLLTDTDYYFKLIFNKGNIRVLLSTDNINWSTEIDRNITLSQEYTYNLSFGRGRINTSYFRGSIDIPKCYIKLGSTKYKFIFDFNINNDFSSLVYK